MHEHYRMLDEIYNALQTVGRKFIPTTAGFGNFEESAENCSKLQLTSATGKRYILSLIEDENAEC